MITREEFNASIDSGFFDDAIEYVDQLEQHIKHQSEQIECLEHNCKVKEDNSHTAYKNYLKMVNSLEQKVKDLESQLLSNPEQLTKLTNEELMTELSSRGIDGDEFDEFADEYNNEWGE